MTQNKVMKLWTAIVTAFLALCTALGLVTATHAAAATRPETPSQSTAHRTAQTIPAMNHWAWSNATALLPPTMKQRIRAEAHGKSPSCRHRPLAETPAEPDTADQSTAPLDC
ncbi:hypothetical protein AQI88_18770 [Streptomyces cellostaticus]|uniref:Secreted protein n=1 Tax=Streptomyces cellostaticus TaxID=67285 RepID=A0A101NKM5_9ACTN|nr:DUF6344 domain-containing protein [Streptomyces cellostaticus]KUM94890.1 hypothetical protein AQI88_18770 [Streptomyces cellostaticus]GHI06388.1 hypothetical protein Scel_47090 [Streptomyces cellostaticus]